ncbi:MAG TPA: arylsulfatase [Myxococcales bacterium]|nr:arylsulfatase [Myxococcales bacterium]
MNRAIILLTTMFLWVVALPVQQSQAKKRSRPHILLIVADDLGYNDVGFHSGAKNSPTPVIDKLAKNGVELTNFYVHPLCSPTRAAMLTGRHPIRYGMQFEVIRPWMENGLSLNEFLLPQALKRANYKSVIIGKWHLGHSEKYQPFRRGFDHQYGPHKGAINYYSKERGGEVDWFRNGKQVKNEKSYATNLLGKEAVKIIQEHNKKQPLFMYLPFNAVHVPLQGPPKHKKPKLKKIKGEGKKAYKERLDKETFRWMLKNLDTNIGRILAALKERKMRKNTLVFFISDNGGHKGISDNSPFRGNKGSFYEGGIRVVSIVNWPAQLKAGKRDQPMHAVDLYPTLLNLVGVDSNGIKQQLPIDGIDVWPTVAREATLKRKDLFLNVHRNLGAIRSGRWKLYVKFASCKKLEGNTLEQCDKCSKVSGKYAHRKQLFDLSNDPGETKDLAAKKRKVVARMFKELMTYDAAAKEEVFYCDTTTKTKKKTKKKKK